MMRVRLIPMLAVAAVACDPRQSPVGAPPPQQRAGGC